MTIATPQLPPHLRLIDRSCAHAELGLIALLDRPAIVGYQLGINGIIAVLNCARRHLAHPVARDLVLLCAEQVSALFFDIGARSPVAADLSGLERRLRGIAYLLPEGEGVQQ